MRRFLDHSWTLRLCAWILGAVMAAAALPKLMDPPSFAQTLHHYRLLPEVLLNPLALGLPWLELVVALALVAGPARRSAAALTLVLMAFFIGALALNLWRGNPVDCGCFGAGGPRTEVQRLFDMKIAILRDLGLLLLALNLVRPARPQT